jgi:tetratricopeptide (TPR) repeat protein
MQIIHKIDDFLKELFPRYRESGLDTDVLKEEIASYYTFGAFKPAVKVEKDLVIVDIDTSTILSQDKDYRNVVMLCEKGKYGEAKTILKPLMAKNPTNSEYHRIYGQILSDEGDQDGAVDALIDALRWDPRNAYALIMMGNIFARNKNDIDTAQKYYRQVLKLNPDDNIALNNIGANLLQLGKLQEGIEYLEKAFAANDKYPNTSFGLAVAYQKMEMPIVAFDFAVHCMKVCPSSSDMLYKQALTLAFEIAEIYVKSTEGMNVFNEFRSHLELKTGREIRVEKDPSIPTAAKFEFAENYDRDYHFIKYKPGYPAVEHLMMHELVHLEFATEAQESKTNMLFISGRDMRSTFLRDNEKDIKRLHAAGYNEESISNFMNQLYEGICRQIFNAPIDLFIEDFLYENYKELRPYQFLSLYNLVNEGKEAVTNKQALKLTPTYILTATKVLNLVNAIQFKDLYGIDMVKQFAANTIEANEAKRMWEEFAEYRKDRGPGEEYEIIKHWGEDLRLDKYFELVDEIDFRNRPKTVEEVLKSVEEDPFGTEVDKNFKEKEMNRFQESQKELGMNPAVMMFMVDALQYFNGMPNEKIKRIAFEIAMIGTQGISPGGDKKYKVSLIPGKEFSGYHLLAYYYVSWKLAIPEMLAQLQLPYDNEFEAAETMFRSKP